MKTFALALVLVSISFGSVSRADCLDAYPDTLRRSKVVDIAEAAEEAAVVNGAKAFVVGGLAAIAWSTARWKTGAKIGAGVAIAGAATMATGFGAAVAEDHLTRDSYKRWGEQADLGHALREAETLLNRNDGLARTDSWYGSDIFWDVCSLAARQSPTVDPNKFTRQLAAEAMHELSHDGDLCPRGEPLNKWGFEMVVAARMRKLAAQ